jgi:hypothetical protein
MGPHSQPLGRLIQLEIMQPECQENFQTNIFINYLTTQYISRSRLETVQTFIPPTRYRKVTFVEQILRIYDSSPLLHLPPTPSFTKKGAPKKGRLEDSKPDEERINRRGQ